jgi:hypothetical protein
MPIRCIPRLALDYLDVEEDVPGVENVSTGKDTPVVRLDVVFNTENAESIRVFRYLQDTDKIIFEK